MPPGRRSISAFVVQPSRRPNHRSTSSGFVHASKTRCRGALKLLVITISRSPRAVTPSSGLVTVATFRLPVLHLVEDLIELHERLLPEPAVFAGPHRDLLDGGGREAARSPLAVTRSGHEARVLEHLQVARHRGQADVEGL